MTTAQDSTLASAFSPRWLLPLVTVSLGGYLLIFSLTGQFIQLFTGIDLGASYGVLLTLQLLFAVAVVLLGFFFAPVTLARRGVAGGIVVGVVFVVIVLQAVRLSAGFGPASAFVGFTFADALVMLPAALGAAWLVVRRRPGLAYASIAVVFLLALVHWALVINGVDSAASQLVMLILAALATSAIAWAGFLTSRIGHPAAPAVYTQPNDRPAVRGPVI